MKVFFVSYLGCLKGEVVEEFCLIFVAVCLGELFGKEVKKVDEVYGDVVKV